MCFNWILNFQFAVAIQLCNEEPVLFIILLIICAECINCYDTFFIENSFQINKTFSLGETKITKIQNHSIGKNDRRMDNLSHVQCFENFFGLIITVTIHVDYNLICEYFIFNLIK